MKVSITSILLLFVPFFCAAEKLYDCLPDATGQFNVDGTMRYCDWAAQDDTEEKCKIEVVAWQCPVTCQVPCIDRDGNGAVIGAAVVTPSTEKKKVPVSVIVTVCIFGLVAIAALVGYDNVVKRKRELHSDKNVKNSEEDIENVEGDVENVEEDVESVKGDMFVIDEMDAIAEEELQDPIEPTRQSSISTQVVTKRGLSCFDPC
eukprot:CAMPEP_0176489890 /NCGR_PEP_ID=MMETSP0200_2-20121128/7558_1 /TAXON_ID=947934 /ORGANISM="Chaetoceros sp., Strain GSL56" /LENGTH=203 /DNA_ID=CAMNT_0017887119 /DNA_START=54 /DNA_END=665 /DNA_ORIENTATION=+